MEASHKENLNDIHKECKCYVDVCGMWWHDQSTLLTDDTSCKTYERLKNVLHINDATQRKKGKMRYLHLVASP